MVGSNTSTPLRRGSNLGVEKVADKDRPLPPKPRYHVPRHNILQGGLCPSGSAASTGRERRHSSLFGTSTSNDRKRKRTTGGFPNPLDGKYPFTSIGQKCSPSSLFDTSISTNNKKQKTARDLSSTVTTPSDSRSASGRVVSSSSRRRLPGNTIDLTTPDESVTDDKPVFTATSNCKVPSIFVLGDSDDEDEVREAGKRRAIYNQRKKQIASGQQSRVLKHTLQTMPSATAKPVQRWSVGPHTEGADRDSNPRPTKSAPRHTEERHVANFALRSDAASIPPCPSSRKPPGLSISYSTHGAIELRSAKNKDGMKSQLQPQPQPITRPPVDATPTVLHATERRSEDQLKCPRPKPRTQHLNDESDAKSIIAPPKGSASRSGQRQQLSLPKAPPSSNHSTRSSTTAREKGSSKAEEQQLFTPPKSESSTHDLGLDQLRGRLRQASEERHLQEKKRAEYEEQREAAARARREAAEAEKARAADEARRRLEADLREQATAQREAEERRQRHAILEEQLRQKQEQVRQQQDQARRLEREARAERRSAACQQRPPAPIPCPTPSSQPATPEPARKQAPEQEKKTVSSPSCLSEEPEAPQYKSLTSRLRAETAAANAQQNAAKHDNIFACSPRPLSSREGTAAVARLNKNRSRSDLGTREITVEDGQVYIWRETHATSWSEIRQLYEAKFQHALSETTLRRRLEQFKNAIKDRRVGIDLIQKLANGDEEMKKLINDKVHANTDGLRTDPGGSEPPVGQISDVDAQILLWRDENHEHYHGAYSWAEIVQKLEYAGAGTVGENVLKARYTKVKKALDEAGIANRLIVELSHNNERAKREVNQVVNGAWPVPGKSFWAAYHTSTKLDLRRPASEVEKALETQPRSAIPDTPTSPLDLGAEQQDGRPTQGGKTIDANFFFHILNLTAQDEQDLVQEHEEEEQSDDEEEESSYYYYRLLRREFTQEEIDDANGDEDELDQKQWIECGKGSENLYELNAKASSEILKTVPGQPVFAHGTFRMERNEQEDGTLHLTLVNDMVGKVEVVVYRDKRYTEERSLGPAFAPSVPKRVFHVKHKITTTTTAVDEVFGETTETSTKVTEAYIGNTLTDLDDANEAAIDHFTQKIVRPKDSKLGRLWTELEAKRAELRNGLVSLDKFYGKVESGGDLFEVWVEEGRLSGPRNI